MARVNDRSQFYLPLYTFIHKKNKPYLPLLLSHRASPHFDRYSFPVPLRVGGWASGPGWLSEILRWFGRSKTITHPSTSCLGGRQSNSQPSSRKSNALTTAEPMCDTTYCFYWILVHGQVTIIFVVSVCLFVCLCRVFLSLLRSDLDQTRTHVTCPGLV